jgi:mono/diheme cytochrome c family protein
VFFFILPSHTHTADQVTNGKGAMPAWGNVLDDEEIDAVANYVFETSSAGKW